MVNETIDKICDISLRVTFSLLYALIKEPGIYTLKSLSKKLGYNIKPIIISCLNQGLFEFYSGNIRITPDNANEILKLTSSECLTVVTRQIITDEDGNKAFKDLMEDYKKSYSEKKNFEKIMVFNSFRTVDDHEGISMDSSIIRLLSENKSIKYEYLFDGSHFYPLSLFNSRSYNRVYFVALKEDDKGLLIKFYPSDYSKPCTGYSAGSVSIPKIYSDENAVMSVRNSLKTIWGPHDIYLHEKPFDVTAIIYDRSCLEKIKHDFSNHIYKLEEVDDGTYILSGKVLGYNAFKIWALSYGSSIEIKTPKRLREDLRKTYEKVINRNA